MKKFKSLLVGLMIISLIISITGCSSNKAPNSGSAAAPKEEPKAAVTDLRVGTSNVGGSYGLIATAYGLTLSKFQPDIKFNIEVTGGSVDNVKLLQKGDLHLGISIASITKAAAEGTAPFTEKADLRALTAINMGRAHIIVRNGTNIKTIKDLKGKRVSTGEPGNSTEVIALAILEAAGINVEKDMTRQRTNLSDSLDAIADGRCDAFINVSGLIVPAIKEATTTVKKSHLIGIEPDVMESVTKKYSYFVKTIIPKDSYGNSEDLPTIGAANHLLARPDITDDVAYKIVKTLFENRDDWVGALSSAKEQTLEFAVQGSPVPYHPGAIRYYKEKGVWKE